MRDFVISIAKGLRVIANFWIAEPSYKHLKIVRTYEIHFALKLIPMDVESIVEVGGGLGYQAMELKEAGFQVRSFDIDSSNYTLRKNDLVELYDGQNIPVSDASVDLIFSSNVLEHIPDIEGALAEQQRVMKDGGYCLHILPSVSWRFWTSVTDLIKKWYLSPPHGEHSLSIFQELFDFRVGTWKKRFEYAGFEVISVTPGGVFCTGNAILGERLSINARIMMAKLLGSQCNYFLLKKVS